ncbi:MAG TPA: PP2C family protein-serine/threonine phosphatase [Thermomicrobiales bacterium]|nr:PP2C family protein-serine/threonine phosphatase [Thermomicrobiales bacterium]
MAQPVMLDLGLAKTEKYASRDSGDTVEIVERPGGGFSVVMIDGQGSGQAAKTLSLLLSSKAVGLIKEGVRDGAVARATHDHLFMYRHGRVSATLDLLSVDMKTRSVVVTRNADAPMLMGQGGEYRTVDVGSGPIGRYHFTKPDIREMPLDTGLTIVLFTDGIPQSGRRARSDPIDYIGFAVNHFDDHLPAQEMADRLLEHAVERDDGRPVDDMAVVALRISDHHEPRYIRRMQAQFPML